MLKENERLRYKILKLEEKRDAYFFAGSGSDEVLTRLAESLKQLEEEKEALQDRFKEVEAENKDFCG